MQSESNPLRFCVKSSPRLFYNGGFLRHHSSCFQLLPQDLWSRASLTFDFRMLSATKLIKISVLVKDTTVFAFFHIIPPPPDPSDEEAVVAYNTLLNRYEGGVVGKRRKKLRVSFRDQLGGELAEVVGMSDGADVDTEPDPIVGKWLTSSYAHELAALSNTEAASQHMFHGSYNNPYPMVIMPLGSLLCPLFLQELRAESCECDRWRVRHSSSSKSSVASLENRRLLTFAKFAEKHRQNPRLLENLSESKAPG
ncbi:hypothetical protein YC2023_045045 [Brassica napus]